MLIAPILCIVSASLFSDIAISLELGCFLQPFSAFFGFIDVLFVKRLKRPFTIAMKFGTKSNKSQNS